MADLDEAGNRQLFGGFAGSEGHGHNYRVEIAVSGPVDERTGMVVNITDLDRTLKDRVVSELDGRFLNREVPHFRRCSPTTENLALYIRDSIAGDIGAVGRLEAVTVWETDMLRSEWTVRARSRGEAFTNMITLTRSYDFCASHRLHSALLTDEENLALFGKCNNPNGHGHNYEIEVSMRGTPPADSGMLYNLTHLDRAVQEEVLDAMDHKHLNLDVPDFAAVNPTSEMLAVAIWRRLARRLPIEGDPRLCRVLVRETARNSFEYCGEGQIEADQGA